MARPRSPPPLPRPRLALRRRWRRARRSPALWWSAAAATVAACRPAGLVARRPRHRPPRGLGRVRARRGRDLRPRGRRGDRPRRRHRRTVATRGRPPGAITEVPTGQVVIAAVVDGEAVIDRRLARGPARGGGARPRPPPGDRRAVVGCRLRDRCPTVVGRRPGRRPRHLRRAGRRRPLPPRRWRRRRSWSTSARGPSPSPCRWRTRPGGLRRRPGNGDPRPRRRLLTLLTLLPSYPPPPARPAVSAGSRRPARRCRPRGGRSRRA